jgi:hypothetical protein
MPAETVSDEIRHLKRDKGYSQDRAVAAAMSMRRAGKLKDGGRKMKRKIHKRGGKKRY